VRQYYRRRRARPDVLPNFQLVLHVPVRGLRVAVVLLGVGEGRGRDHQIQEKAPQKEKTENGKLCVSAARDLIVIDDDVVTVCAMCLERSLFLSKKVKA